MSDTKLVNYDEEKGIYYKILFGLLLMTTVTFVQPHLFMVENTFLAQMIVAVIKAWMILIYYMHLKGDKLIGAMVWFTLFLVTVFFIITIAVDVVNFQFGSDSYITSHVAEHTTHATHGEH